MKNTKFFSAKFALTAGKSRVTFLRSWRPSTEAILSEIEGLTTYLARWKRRKVITAHGSLPFATFPAQRSA